MREVRHAACLGALLLPLLALPATGNEGQAAAGAGYTVEVPRLSSPPTLDGHLAAAEWDGAARLDGFVQLEPQEGAPASEATEVRIGYDPANLYIGIRGHDSEAGAMVANILTRDGDLSYDDSIEIVLDTYHDRQSGFLFATNPLGVQVDALVRREGEEINFDWDGLWSCRAGRDAGGFTVEIAIPFRTLRFPRSGEQVWGINVTRLIPRKQEVSSWKPMSRDYGHYARYKVSQFGQLTGLEGLEPGRRSLFKPYLVAGWEDQNEEMKGDEVVEVGLDAKVNLTTDLVADFTVNTDFAEAEADDQRVNLTRFPLFFPEKREFFLEGANLFYVGERPEPYRDAEDFLFFSRRIGLTDDGGREIPVLGGAKITGQMGDLGLGFLNLTTDGETFRDPESGTFTEPRTNYTVVRLKQDLLGGSYVGFMGLNTDPSGLDYNRVAAADWDFELREHLRTGGFLARSSGADEEGDEWAGYADLNWDSKHSRVRLAYTDLGDGFRDELGFFPRLGVKKLRADLNAVLWPDGGRVRTAWFTYDVDYVTDQAGNLETRAQGLQANMFFRSSAGLAFKAFDDREVLTAPFEVARGVVIPAGTYDFRNYFVGFQTNYNRPLGGAGRVLAGDYFDGDIVQAFGALVYRPVAGLFTAATYERTEVDLPAGSFTTELSLAEVTYSFNPRLSTRAWLQWQSEENLLGRLVVKWTYRPGADFFFIYEDLQDLTDPLDRFDRRVGIPGRSILTKTVFVF